jgi:hypothetical protein
MSRSYSSSPFSACMVKSGTALVHSSQVLQRTGPKPLGYRHCRWQPKSHLQRGNTRQFDSGRWCNVCPCGNAPCFAESLRYRSARAEIFLISLGPRTNWLDPARDRSMPSNVLPVPDVLSSQPEWSPLCLQCDLTILSLTTNLNV